MKFLRTTFGPIWKPITFDHSATTEESRGFKFSTSILPLKPSDIQRIGEPCLSLLSTPPLVLRSGHQQVAARSPVMSARHSWRPSRTIPLYSSRVLQRHSNWPWLQHTTRRLSAANYHHHHHHHHHHHTNRFRWHKSIKKTKKSLGQQTVKIKNGVKGRNVDSKLPTAVPYQTAV